jgi:hypothetical protein
MPKLTEEDLLKNLDFSCSRCSAECQKINALEPEVGYKSKVDGTWIGPLCQNCLKEIPIEEQVPKKVIESAFTIIIQADGGGAMLIDGASISYRRDATYLDIINACNQVIRDLEEAIFAQKLTNKIISTLATANKKSSILMPR